jgi:hypothetical protein
VFLSGSLQDVEEHVPDEETPNVVFLGEGEAPPNVQESGSTPQEQPSAGTSQEQEQPAGGMDVDTSSGEDVQPPVKKYKIVGHTKPVPATIYGE